MGMMASEVNPTFGWMLCKLFSSSQDFKLLQVLILLNGLKRQSRFRRGMSWYLTRIRKRLDCATARLIDASSASFQKNPLLFWEATRKRRRLRSVVGSCAMLMLTLLQSPRVIF